MYGQRIAEAATVERPALANRLQRPGTMKRAILALLAVFVSGLPAYAQQTPPPLKLWGADVSGSLRLRGEAWDWFDSAAADDEYTFGGALLRLSASRTTPRLDWQVEAAAPALISLPDDAVAPAPQGQLGFGGSYFAANRERDTASLFLKQAFVRFKSQSSSTRLGRFEFIEGLEAMPKDPRLAALRRDRIAHRLIGNFGFTHVGRSIDGAHFNCDCPAGNITAVAGFPTRGVFDVDGQKTLDDVFIGYGGFTRGFSPTGEWRLFVTTYGDERNVIKTDNRPAAVRSADRESINVHSLGGHYLHTFDATLNPNLLVWGNWQTGDWGTQDHSAWAMAVEGGVAPGGKWSPTIRAGWFRGSGDSSPLDGDHETFFPMLPTPRIYARFPFYNTMNNEDVFVSLGMKPNPKIALRADVHRLSLSERNDLWYVGGGAFEDSSFGYAGRPSNGETSLGTLADLSVDVTLSPVAGLGLYFARAFGSDVVERIYPEGGDGSFFYVEFSRRF